MKIRESAIQNFLLFQHVRETLNSCHTNLLIVLANASTLAWLLSNVLLDIVTLIDSMHTLSVEIFMNDKVSTFQDIL